MESMLSSLRKLRTLPKLILSISHIGKSVVFIRILLGEWGIDYLTSLSTICLRLKASRYIVIFTDLTTFEALSTSSFCARIRWVILLVDGNRCLGLLTIPIFVLGHVGYLSLGVLLALGICYITLLIL